MIFHNDRVLRAKCTTKIRFHTLSPWYTLVRLEQSEVNTRQNKTIVRQVERINLQISMILDMCRKQDEQTGKKAPPLPTALVRMHFLENCLDTQSSLTVHM